MSVAASHIDAVSGRQCPRSLP